MAQTILSVCSLCRFSANEKSRHGVSGGQYLIEQLQTAISQESLFAVVQLEQVRCMAHCSQPCNVTLAAPGKLTFILSGLSPTESASTLLEFYRQYRDQPDGKVPYRERSATIHKATAFILPPLPTISLPQS